MRDRQDRGVTDLAVPRFAPFRRALGILLLGAAAAALVLFALGLVNPWRLVWLSRYFGNPPVGLAVVTGLAFFGSWLAFPVQNEAVHNRRIMFRIGTGIGTAIAGLLAWGFGPVFDPTITPMARSADGDRSVVLVERADRSRELHVWAGSGLLTRDVGVIGRACGEVEIEFLSRDRFALTSSYGGWEIDLDPDTGSPRQVLGPRCKDGPRPATLDR